MSSRILFVYDNLKVTLHPGDGPYDGFEIIAGETQCTVKGTLYDLGENAGFIPEGNTLVKGQIWTAQNYNLIQELKDFAYPKGNVRLQKVSVTITEDKDNLVIPATVFALNSVPASALKVNSGFWAVRSHQIDW